MAATPIVGSFPSPFEIETPPGCEGWEEHVPVLRALRRGARARPTSSASGSGTRCTSRCRCRRSTRSASTRAYYALGTGRTASSRSRRRWASTTAVINAYIYISVNAVTDPAKIAERAEFFQKRAGYYFAELGRAVREVANEDGGADRGARGARGPGAPRVRARRGRLRRPGDELLRACSTRYRRCLSLSELMWQHHFEFLLLGYGAYMTFAELCKAQPARHPRPAHRADGRRARRAALQARRGAAAPRAARGRHGRRRGVRRGALAGRDRRRRSRERRRAGVARGAREGQGPVVPHGDGRRPVPHYGSLARRPDDPVRVARSATSPRCKAGEDIERPTASTSPRERDRLATEYAELLDDERARAFEELLALSRTVFPYVEEHKFICDYWFLTSWWNKIREFGDLLVAHGFLHDRDGIFQLSRLEVHAALDELAADVGDRRRCRAARRTGRRSSRSGASCSSSSPTGRRRRRSARCPR